MLKAKYQPFAVSSFTMELWGKVFLDQCAQCVLAITWFRHCVKLTSKPGLLPGGFTRPQTGGNSLLLVLS